MVSSLFGFGGSHNLGALVAEVGLDTARLASDSGKAKAQISSLGSALGTAHVGGLGSAFNLASLGAVGAGAAIGGVGLAAIKSSIQFESAFAGVRKTVNATESEFADLSDGIRRMSTEIPVAATELAAIGEVAGQLGIEAANILSFTRVVADLAVTTNLTASQAATSFARIANITNLSQDEFDRMASSLVALGNASATTEAEIIELTQRIAGASDAAGITNAGMLGIAAAASSVGLGAEAAGTAIQKVMLAMVQAVANGSKELELFADTTGLTVDEFVRLFESDANDAFARFVEGLGRQGDAAFQTLEMLELQDQRLIRTFLALSNAGGLLRDEIALSEKAWLENTAATEEAEKRYETTESQLGVLKNTIVDLGIELGDKFTPAINDSASALTNFINFAKDFPTVPRLLGIEGVLATDPADSRRLRALIEQGDLPPDATIVDAIRLGEQRRQALVAAAQPIQEIADIRPSVDAIGAWSDFGNFLSFAIDQTREVEAARVDEMIASIEQSEGIRAATEALKRYIDLGIQPTATSLTELANEQNRYNEGLALFDRVLADADARIQAYKDSLVASSASLVMTEQAQIRAIAAAQEQREETRLLSEAVRFFREQGLDLLDRDFKEIIRDYQALSSASDTLAEDIQRINALAGNLAAGGIAAANDEFERTLGLIDQINRATPTPNSFNFPNAALPPFPTVSRFGAPLINLSGGGIFVPGVSAEPGTQDPVTGRPIDNSGNDQERVVFMDANGQNRQQAQLRRVADT